MDISRLTPEQQQALLAAIGQSNQQSMDPSAFGVQQPTQPQAQQSSAPTPAPEPGSFKDDPEGAMAHIASQVFGPAAPKNVNLATGPKLTQDSNGQLMATLPADHPLLRALGVKQHIPVRNPNYFEAAQSAGIDKFLPSGLAQMPDGTPFVGKTAYDQALSAQRTVVGQGKEIYNSLDQLTSQGIPEDIGRSLLAANPKGVTSKEVSNYMGSERTKTAQQMADARSTLAGVAKLAQALKVGGFDAAQPMAETANKNLGAVQRVQAAIDQVVAGGGVANEIQRSEIAAGLAVLAANGSGVVTDERMNRFLPDTYKNKYGNFMEMLKNERNPVDFTGFLPQFQDLLIREKQANQGISSAAAQMGINIMGITNPKGASAIAGARNATPIVGNGQVNGTVGAPTTAPITKPTGVWKVVR